MRDGEQRMRKDNGKLVRLYEESEEQEEEAEGSEGREV
jgi:hypothetical protein